MNLDFSGIVLERCFMSYEPFKEITLTMKNKLVTCECLAITQQLWHAGHDGVVGTDTTSSYLEHNNRQLSLGRTNEATRADSNCSTADWIVAGQIFC